MTAAEALAEMRGWPVAVGSEWADAIEAELAQNKVTIAWLMEAASAEIAAKDKRLNELEGVVTTGAEATYLRDQLQVRDAEIKMLKQENGAYDEGMRRDRTEIERLEPFVNAAMRVGAWLKSEAERKDAMVVHSFVTGAAQMCREYCLLKEADAL